MVGDGSSRANSTATLELGGEKYNSNYSKPPLPSSSDNRMVELRDSKVGSEHMDDYPYETDQPNPPRTSHSGGS